MSTTIASSTTSASPDLPADLMTMDTPRFIAHCRRLYRKTLLEDVVPFWLRHGIDRQYGGIGNLLDDAGNVTGTDKWLWSQGRALWTFSALCNRIERRAEWLAFADHIFQYLRTHGRDEQGRWMFRLDKNGNVLDRDISIYVDGFVLAGMTEYYAATKNEEALRIALQTYENVLARLAKPGSYGLAPYSLPPGMKTHGVSMIFGLFFFELGRLLNRQDIINNALDHAYQILKHFYRPEKDAVVEFVTTDGRYVDSPEGRTCVPGHALESMWFLISIFERTGDLDSIQTCCRIIKRHLELAWDEEYGGLMLARDVDGIEPPFWKYPQYKPWWVQVEALVATAYAYVHTRQPWCLEWHRKVQDFAYRHYPVPTGEWSQWVDRLGNRMGNAFLPVKDPFHLPRALIELIGIFENRLNP
ncbi:AGE family epimerase/isomerase [Fontivita pretiosa]|uniref:AGE family epimerase/isomerase n=1 Tax=Fontivita pretiosa TaxID=2989684 RepID=UPI003D171AEA